MIDVLRDAYGLTTSTDARAAEARPLRERRRHVGERSRA
jgi:hypothetical protein